MLLIALPLGLLRIYAALTGTTSITWEAPGWLAALAFWGGLLVLHNTASVWVLVRQARLEGPIDHSP